MAKLVRKLGKSRVQTYPLDNGKQRIGRASGNEIQLLDPSVSGHHADIVVTPSPYMSGKSDCFIVDRESRNGVIVNGDRHDRCRLKHGDQIRIGNQKLEFIDESSDSGDRTIIKQPDK